MYVHKKETERFANDGRQKKKMKQDQQDLKKT